MKETATVYNGKGEVIDTYEYEVPDSPRDLEAEIDSLKRRIEKLEAEYVLRKLA